MRCLRSFAWTILSFISISSVHAQILDTFDPNVNGTVRVILAQPDGKILIGGLFTSLAPNGGPTVTRNNIARVNADGSLDTAFNPDANSDIYSMALQPDGKILVGGYFTSIGGQFRNRIARLDPVTGAADSFNPGANEVVRSIVIDANGRILVGGGFIVFGGQPRLRIARLDANGVLDAFSPTANDLVYSIAIQPDGMILAGGAFTTIGGQPRNRIARLNPDTGLADSFNPDASKPDATGDVLTLALQSDNKILVGGFFNTIGAQPRNNIARLDPTTGLADSFDPNANTTVHSIVVQPDTKILVGGGFTTIGGQSGRLARLNPTTAAVEYIASASQTITTIALQSGGNFVVGGQFTLIVGQPRNRMARFVVAQPPKLNIQLAPNNQVVITWPASVTGFLLESNPDLNQALWTTVAPQPTIVGTNNAVTNTAAGLARFYRLRQ